MNEHEFGDDVPESQQAQGRMDELFRALIENALDVITILDAEGVIRYQTPSIERMLGYKPAELIGMNIVELLHPDDVPKANVAIKVIAPPNGTPGIAKVWEARIRHKDGSWRILESIGKALPSGTPVIGIAINSRDITERKRAEEELTIANKELIFQNEEKEKRAAELVIANKELIFQNEEKEKRATELYSLQKKTDRRLQNIEALHTIDQAISGSHDLSLTLSIILEQVATQLNVDAAAVLLLNPHTQTLEYTSVRGFRSKTITRSHLRLGEGLAGHTALEQRLVSLDDLCTEKEEFVHSDLLAGEDFVSYHGMPLIIKGQVKGVLEVFLRSHRTVDDEWLNFIATLAGQVGIALDNASLYFDLQRSNTNLFNAFDSTIEGWSYALDLRDKETEGHALRVTELTERLARAMGIDEAEIVHIRRGALLHDIGKMGVPDGILLKPGKLTDEEWEVMIKHPQFAYDMLVPIAYLKPALDIPYCHHEKWDGTGYPRGLKGEQIPLVARIFAIVDVWDALTSDRPYRKAWTKEKALNHIQEQSGAHFDPEVVKLFLQEQR